MKLSEQHIADTAVKVAGRPGGGAMKPSLTNSRGRLESIQGCHLSQAANYQQPQPL